MNQADALARVEDFAANAWGRIPEPSSAPPVAWRRDGLMALFARAEALKAEALLLTSLQAEAARVRGLCLSWLTRLRHAEDDKMADGLQSRVTRQVGQGMAWEERRVAHQTQAVDVVVWRRRFETAAVEIEALEDALKARYWAVKDERLDIATQTRLIERALEINEV